MDALTTKNSEQNPLAALLDKVVAALDPRRRGKVRQQAWQDPICDPAELLDWVISRQALVFGKTFEIDQHNADFIRTLTLYFAGDPQFEALGNNYSLRKGLLLQGGTGTGKTYCMRAFNRNPMQSFSVNPCRDISLEYSDEDKGGARIIRLYASPTIFPAPDRAYFGQKVIGRLYDDLGTENETANFFGNKIKVLAEVLQICYDKQLSYPFNLWHLTTNLTLQEIETRYGYRLRSRLSEMFNLIKVTGPDRRRHHPQPAKL